MEWTVVMEDGRKTTRPDAEAAERFAYYHALYSKETLVRVIDVESRTIRIDQIRA